MLSIRRTNFTAGWAYAEQIASLAEHAGNEFHRWLSIRGNVKKSNISAVSNTIFKNLVLQALGTIRFRFLQKKSLKKVHACVPLKPANSGVKGGYDSYPSLNPTLSWLWLSRKGSMNSATRNLFWGQSRSVLNVQLCQNYCIARNW
jgi:hypothetical protein